MAIKHIRGSVAAVTLAAASALYAVEPEVPIIEFHTTIYETYGTTNSFHIVLGAKDAGTYFDVDCGFGTFEAEVGQGYFDSESGAMSGTAISCSVSSEGWVRIYGDASQVEYLDCEGCYIDRISFPDLTEVQILDLSHNELLGLDLSHMTKLQYLVLSDNPMTETPLIIGPNKPDLAILEISSVRRLDSSFNLSDYPAMRSFEAFSCPDLRTLDPTGCPDILRISVDVTPLESIDVSKCPSLLILNVADTHITSLDLHNNPYLTELYAGHLGVYSKGYKISEIDLSNNKLLQRLYLDANNLTSLDISMCPELTSFSASANNLPGIDFSNNTKLVKVSIKDNCMDFVTIPEPLPMMNEYYYAQKPLPVDRLFKEGDVIDLTSRLIRPGTTTTAYLYSIDEAQGEYTLMPASSYTWDEGRITLNEACADSLFLAFSNSMFPEANLYTNSFMVKTAAQYGKPSKAAELHMSGVVSDLRFSVGIDGATAENPKTFTVDFGDGVMKEFTATGAEASASPNVTGTRKGYISIYVPEGSVMTAFAIDGYRMLEADFSTSPSLRTLAITNCRLPSIDLKWNRCLTSLDLSNNLLATIDLAGVNGNYGKNVLEHLDLSNNKLTEVGVIDGASFITMDLSHNMLTEAPLDRNFRLKALNVADNQLTSLKLSDCEALETLDISFNNFTTVDIPETSPVTSLNIAGNKLYFSTLPAVGTYADYTYAPQQPIELPDMAPVADLSVLSFGEGADATVFTWYHTDGTPCTADEVTARGAVFTFAGASVGMVYCEATNPAFPAFSGDNAFYTSAIEAADMPTVSFLEFDTTADGDAYISMKGVNNNTTVYIDWSGDGNLVQYILDKETYTTFPAKTHAGATVKAYAYTAANDVSVFSISDATMSRLDASGLRQANGFFVYNAGLADGTFTLPDTDMLEELSINGCNITDLKQIADYPNLRFLSINNNKIAKFDASKAPSLTNLYASGNGMTEITLANPKMWELTLNDNDFTAIDLSGVPAMQQLWLTGNHLKQIDLRGLSSLRVVALSNNEFTFATLPPVLSQYIMYDYGRQKDIEITVEDGNKVDLSDQAYVQGEYTDYYWFIDSPYYDEEGNLYGEELYEADEYTIAGGVTTFLGNFHHIICVMKNAAFPSLDLYTNYINITDYSGIENATVDEDGIAIAVAGNSIAVEAPAGTPIALISTSGSVIGTAVGSHTFDNVSAGIYVVAAGNKAVKVAVR